MDEILINNMIDSVDNTSLKSCKGKIYRADVINKKIWNGIIFSIHLTEVKELSCPGCEFCVGLDESLNNINNKWNIIDIEKAEDGMLYSIDICNITTDWETGKPNNWNLKLIEVKTMEKEVLEKAMEINNEIEEIKEDIDKWNNFSYSKVSDDVQKNIIKIAITDLNTQLKELEEKLKKL